MTQALVQLLLALPLVGAYSMFALGIVVIYRASGVLNLAHGAMAMFPAYICYSLWSAGAPVGVSFAAGVLAGAALGFVVERFVLRPLRNESATVQTVGTVAVLGVLVAIAARVWGTAPLRAPNVFPEGTIAVGRSVLHAAEVGLFLAAIVAAVLFFVLLQRTPLGLAMRGAADNARAARLFGVDPERMTSVAWMLGGTLAAAGGIMLAGATNLHPYTLSLQVLPAFVAALIGGLGSLAGALVGAGIVGVVQGLVPSLGPLGRQTGAAQLVLAVVALVTMVARSGARLQAGDVRAGLVGASGHTWPRRRGSARWMAAVLVALVALPWVPFPAAIADSIRADASLAAVYTIVAASLVMLTGWVGQISLAHAAFVGIAAFTTGVLVRALGIPFPLNLPLAAAAAGLAAAALGVVALRVRGLYLAVATLIFGWMADGYLFQLTSFVGEGGSSSIPNRPVGRADGFPFFDLTDRRTFYYIALASAVLALAAAANLRDSRTGRAFFAVRGSEVAAASLGIDVTRTKLLAFALSGTFAGIAGNLMMVDRLTATPSQFDFTASLFFLSMAVVGGVTRLGGAVAGAVLFAALNELFFRVRALDGYLPLVSSALLLIVLLTARTGLAAGFVALAGRLRRDRPADDERVAVPDFEPLARAAGRPVIDIPAAPSERGRRPDDDAMPLVVRSVTVRFGGLVAVEDASLEVCAGEVVGLIGPNGAGKTTLFNAVSGLVIPVEGSVSLFGRDVTRLQVHERARLGLGRTFQLIQLFGDATVAENLLVGAHLHGRTGWASHVLVSARALTEERAARERVRAVLAIAGLEDVADRPAAGLPFGVLRRVEVARAAVTDARLVMLDEPASGLDDRETDELAALLRDLRTQLGLSMLLIEHDVRFVTGISDRMYVLDRGRMLASGTPEEVRSDPAVVAAYLGGATAPAAARSRGAKRRAPVAAGR